MHSSWKVWDYLKGPRQLSTGRVFAFSCYDQFVFKLIRESLNEKYTVVFGQEVTEDWVDQKLKTMDLFGGDENFLIHFAENLSQAAFDKIIATERLILDNRIVILNYSKDVAAFKKLKEHEVIETVSITAPAFWEEMELLSFLAERLEVYFGFPEKKYFCEKVPFGISNYYEMLERLKLSSGDNITSEDIDNLTGHSKFDQFQLAELFGTKKIKIFYRELLAILGENQDIYGFLYFMHSHMQKVYNSDYQKQKKKLTKYDKAILHQQKLWKTDQSARAVNYLMNY